MEPFALASRLGAKGVKRMHRALKTVWAVALFGLSLPALADDQPGKPGAPARTTPPLPNGAVRWLGVPVFDGGDSESRGLVVLPDGKHLITSDADGVVLWELATGKRVATAPAPPSAAGLPKIPISTGMYENGRHVATGKNLFVLRVGRVYRYPLPLADKEPPESISPPLNRDTGRTYDGIVSVAAGPDDRLFAVSTAGRLLELKNTRRAEHNWVDTDCTPVPCEKGKGHDPVLAAGGGVVAVAGQDAKAQLWDVSGKKAKEVGAVEVPGILHDVAVSADGKVLATLNGAVLQDRWVKVWTVADQKEVKEWKAGLTARRLAVSPDGGTVACETAERDIHLYDAKTGKRLLALGAADERTRALEFTPDGSTLVTVGAAGVVRQWDVRTGKPIGPTVAGHTGAVRAVVAAADGGWISAGDDRVLRVWDAAGKEVWQLEGHTAPVTALVLAADGKTVFSAGLDGTVRAWDIEKGKEFRKSEPEKGDLPAGIYSLARSPDGKTLAAGTADGGVRLLDAGTLKAGAVLTAKKVDGWTTAVAFVGDDKLVSRTADGVLHFWDAAKGEEWLSVQAVPKSPFEQAARDLRPTQLAVTPDGKVVSPAGDEKASEFSPRFVGVWESGTGKPLAKTDAGVGAKLSAVAAISNGRVAVGDAKGRVRVIDLEKKEVVRTLTGHGGAVTSIALAADGKTFATGSEDNTVLVWKVEP